MLYSVTDDQLGGVKTMGIGEAINFVNNAHGEGRKPRKPIKVFSNEYPDGIIVG